jgi:hypothetical protein
MRRTGILVATVLGFLAAGCLVDVDHVSDPSAAFKEARQEAAKQQGRSGPAHSLNILAYDASDHELVRVRLPMWLVHKLDEDEAIFEDWDLDDDHTVRLEGVLEHHLSLEDLEDAGLGVLLEVEEDDGERVLIWLS